MIHAYRTIGLGVKLVKETLPSAGKHYVETTEVMTRYNPFFEKAGTQKISEQPPSKKALAIAQVLSELGFNIQLLGSEKYVLNKLRTLKLEDVARIKDAFIRNKAPRFMKYFFPHQPYGRQKLYVEKLMKASLEKLAHLIKICGLLLQTKVYLFWNSLDKSEEILAEAIKRNNEIYKFERMLEETEPTQKLLARSLISRR